MSEQLSLEEVLEGKEVTTEKETEEVKAEEVKAEEVATQEEVNEKRAEKLAELAKGAKETEPPSVEEPKNKEVPIQALLDERDKRKEAQARNVELEKQLEEKQEAPDFFEDPQKAIESIKSSLRAEFKQETETLQERMQTAWLANSIQSATYRHEDFTDEVRDKFADATAINKDLLNQMWNSPDQGEFVYQTGKQMMEIDSAGGDLVALKAQYRAEFLAELKADKDKQESKLAEIPESLTSETSAMTPREKVEGGPTPLENILPSN